MVHLTECLHGGDNLGTGHLLVEGMNKPVGACAIIKSNCEGVKARIKAFCLGAEGQTSGHTQLKRKRSETGVRHKQHFKGHP